MRPVPKVFFFSLVILLLSFLPVDSRSLPCKGSLQALTGQPDSAFSLEGFIKGERDVIQWLDPTVGGFTVNGLRTCPERTRRTADGGPFSASAPFLSTAESGKSPQEQKAIKAIIDDFLVNDDTAGGCDQYDAVIARDYHGNFIVVWDDYRNGIPDIFAQRYDYEGTPIGSNFKVIDGEVVVPRQTPSIAMDDSGNFVIAWTDYRNGMADIYAQRFDTSGTPLDSSFKVNDDAGTFYQSNPAVAMGGYGRFVVTWMDFRGDDWDIYAQRYDYDGNPQGSNFKVNDDVGGTFIQYYPAVAMDDNANFVITWMDDRNGNNDIYAQRYNPQGSPSGSNFKVNDDVGTYQQYYPVVAKVGSGNFVIAWADYRSGADIYAQRYGSDGTPAGSNFKANDDVGSSAQYYPAIIKDNSGNFVITWMDYRDGNCDIYAQRFNASGGPLGANFKVNNDAGTLDQRYPAIGVDGMGNFVITWQDFRDVISDIYAQRYHSSGAVLGSNFKVNDDEKTAVQNVPAIAIDSSGKFVIVWEDHRYDLGDVYLQRYSSSGTPVGSNLMVNDDGGTITQTQPAVAMNGSGNSVVTWQDLRNNNYDIYAQRYDPLGNPQGTNLKVNDDVGTSYQYLPAIAMTNSGNFVITWQDSRNGDYDIYAQMCQSDGSPQGSNFQVNDDVGTIYQLTPAIAMDNSGNFVITWYDTRNGDYDIYAQRYDYSGVPLGLNFKVNDDLDTLGQFTPVVAMDNSGNFVISWQDYRNGNYDVYAQRYDSSGTPIGSNFKANDDTETALQVLTAIAMDGSGKFVIAWRDDRNTTKNDVYAQRYDSSGTPIDSNYLVPNPAYTSFVQSYPAVACDSSKIYFTWMDTRRAKSYDIYAKVADWNWSNYICGDVTGDGVVNSADIVYLINYLFKGGPAPDPIQAGDVNVDGVINSADVVYLINYLFKGGPAPCG
jgi:hypothetical protein